jgi:hypothetical protein
MWDWDRPQSICTEGEPVFDIKRAKLLLYILLDNFALLISKTGKGPEGSTFPHVTCEVKTT